MGVHASPGSERAFDEVAGLRAGTIFSGACGECLEDPGDGVRVQLGCGHKPWPGWINVDGDRAGDCADVVADLRALPFETGTVDTAVAIHVLEHFYEWEAVDVLKEWRRVLKPGGQLIVELPCMDKVFGYLARCAAKRQPIYAQMSWWALWGDPRYKSVEMTHKWGYSQEMLATVLTQAGFAPVSIGNPRYHLKQRDMRALAINPTT